ncbi:MAG: hypothetical protein CFE34_13245 [Rhodobacteraceae bacterium PARR1]|nr:MAG: hypothetical protein CFE34_13245 [Rhodobacteraceae bacterium PARR1]
MLVELEPVPGSALPVADLGAHLRLGTGFASDGLQDGLLASHLRAALAVIEGRIGKALISRRFRWEVPYWREAGGAQALPLAPVSLVVEVALVDGWGGRVVLSDTLWRLRRDSQRPRLEPVSLSFPPVPEGGLAQVVFDAGFGVWAAVPADLRQAVFLLAAEFYEHRHDGGAAVAALPKTVAGLIEGWRTVRLLGGGAA